MRVGAASEQAGRGEEVPTLTITATKGWARPNLGELWQYRELVYFLVWRDVKVRYKQTALGVAWVIVQPLVTVLVFSFVFGRLLRVPSGDVPYPLFALTGLLPWQYFTGALTRSSQSLVANVALITKMYFPRMALPMAASLAGLVDLGVSSLLLVVLLAIFRVPLSSHLLALPVFVGLAFTTSIGFGLWLSALNVRYRDVGYIVPFLIQVWLYATPVIYPIELFPSRVQPLLALNPMTAVVGGFRWSILGARAPDTWSFSGFFFLSVGVVLLVLFGGVVFFRRTERTFADLI
jgi:lipopolysaccharide transport system permease protein